MDRPPDFGRLAPKYDELRPADENWWQLLDLLVREGDLRGRRVLDIGCGTGRAVAALTERHAGRAWGVDPSPEMIEVAQRRIPRGARAKVAQAENLPFKDGWFERVLMWLVVHLVDRAQALAEAHRVLVPEGRVAIATFDPAHFEADWLSRFFPSIARIDRARFPTEERLAEELEIAGFERPRVVGLSQDASIDREAALRKLRGKFVSTLALLDAAEYAEGVARAERDLPDRVEYALEWIVLTAVRPAL